MPYNHVGEANRVKEEYRKNRNLWYSEADRGESLAVFDCFIQSSNTNKRGEMILQVVVPQEYTEDAFPLTKIPGFMFTVNVMKKFDKKVDAKVVEPKMLEKPPEGYIDVEDLSDNGNT